VIWLGDFNYRINGVIGAIQAAMEGNMYEVLQFNDQFYIEKAIKRVAVGFQEGEISFAPTYKLIAGKDLYMVKGRIPGWTDRIIYREGGALKLKSYDSNNEIKFSDHRPVFAQFEFTFDQDKQVADVGGSSGGKSF